MITHLPRQLPGGVRVLERLGEGGMAVVHRAEDPFRPGYALAVKFLRPEATADAELVRRFLREGEVLKRLRHPHLVEVIDYGRAGHAPYLLMELLPGGSVKACLGEAPATLLRRLLPVLGALQYAHEFGVVHRDLKPSNLLFDGEGRLKVTDFGVCLWEGGEGTRVTRSQMVVGTLGYMAPEQHGDPRMVDARCDVYAMATILYEFCTGQPWAQVQLPPASVRPGFPPGLAATLMQALAPDRERRTPSMGALAEALERWLGSAAAAGWGEAPLPGFHGGFREEATLSRANPRRDDAETRLGPYLEALRTGDVGARRNAAEGLIRNGRSADEAFLLAALPQCPDAARFAVVNALAEHGGPASLGPLLDLLKDPYVNRESAEAASRVAQRLGQAETALARLREPGLGSPGRWIPRARLGDETWVEALRIQWEPLPVPLKLQVLEAAQHLPEALRARVRSLTADLAARAGGSLGQAWSALQQPPEGS